MRPDNHKKKKNQAYKTKQNQNEKTDKVEDQSGAKHITRNQSEQSHGKPKSKFASVPSSSSWRNAKSKAASQLSSNSDRYDELDADESPSSGKDMREILESSASLASVQSIELGKDDETAPTFLSLSMDSIEQAMKCFSLSQVIDFSSHPLIEKSIESSSLAAANLDEYVMNSMDPAYTIDHKVSGAAPSTTSIFFQNTGQHLQKELDGCHAGNTLAAQAADDDITLTDVKSNDVHAELELKEAELEDWLDSVLDD